MPQGAEWLLILVMMAIPVVLVGGFVLLLVRLLRR